MGQAVQRAPAADTVHYERRRPEDTTLYQLVQEHLDTFLAQVEAQTGAALPEFVKDEFDAFLECGILAHGFLRLRCAACTHEKLVAFSCKRRSRCSPMSRSRPRGRLTPKNGPDLAQLAQDRLEQTISRRRGGIWRDRGQLGHLSACPA